MANWANKPVDLVGEFGVGVREAVESGVAVVRQGFLRQDDLKSWMVIILFRF